MEPHSYRIYVIAHSADTLERARQTYIDPIFRPILLPQTPFMESTMYTEWLMEHEDEWRNVDIVGCISYSAITKQPNILRMHDILETAMAQGAPFIAFLYRGDPLVSTAVRWHTDAFRVAWEKVWHALGYTSDDIMDDTQIHSFYSNYWATTPSLMREYCDLMHRLNTMIETTPALKDCLWKDSTYQDRGTDIAKMPESTRLELFGVPYYPLLGFVCERMPCLWFSRLQKNTPLKMMLMR